MTLKVDKTCLWEIGLESKKLEQMTYVQKEKVTPGCCIYRGCLNCCWDGLQKSEVLTRWVVFEVLVNVFVGPLRVLVLLGKRFDILPEKEIVALHEQDGSREVSQKIRNVLNRLIFSATVFQHLFTVFHTAIHGNLLKLLDLYNGLHYAHLAYVIGQPLVVGQVS